MYKLTSMRIFGTAYTDLYASNIGVQYDSLETDRHDSSVSQIGLFVHRIPQKKLRWFRSTRFLIAIQPVIASDSHEMGHPPFWPNVQQTIFSIPVWHVPAQAGQYGVRPPHGFFGPTELASGCGLKNRVPMDGATTKWVRFIILPLNCH